MVEGVFFNKLVTKSFNITDPERRLFTGILSVEMKDKQGEIMVIDELMKVLPIWMKRGAPMSNTHTNQIVARGLNFQRVTIKDHEGNSYPGVEIMGEVYKDYQLDNDIWEKMKSGEYKGLSFGGATKADRIPTIWKDGSVAYKLVDLEQYEVAICKDAAVPLAFITDVNTLAKSISKSGKTIGYVAKNNNEICIRCDNVGCYVEKAEKYEEDKKLSPSDAGYVVLKEKSPHCGACIFYKEGGSCTKVSGEIDPVHGCCNIFKGNPDIYKALYEVNKPFAGYKDFAACVAANKDKGDAEAYCATIMRQVEGKNKGLVDVAAVIDEVHDLAEPKEKGMVEDQAGQKCPHCGYIPSDGNETLEQHVQAQHPQNQGTQDNVSGIKNPSDDTREGLNYDHQGTGYDTSENNDSGKTPTDAQNIDEKTEDPQDTSMSANDTNSITGDPNNPLAPQKTEIIPPTDNHITDPMRGMPLEVPVKIVQIVEQQTGDGQPLNGQQGDNNNPFKDPKNPEDSQKPSEKNPEEQQKNQGDTSMGNSKADHSNINATPTPMQTTHNTELPDEKEKALRKTLDNLRLSVLEGKVKNIQKHTRKTI